MDTLYKGSQVSKLKRRGLVRWTVVAISVLAVVACVLESAQKIAIAAQD